MLQNKEIRGWLYFVAAIQVIFAIGLIFCRELYVMPYACVREATFEDWEWFLEAPKQYSPIIRNTFYALLDSRGLLAWILKFGGILGIYRLAFWKKGLFSVGGKSKIVVLFIGAIGRQGDGSSVQP